MSSNLHIKYRPRTLKEVIGQEAAVTALKGYLKNGGIPHCLLFAGPSGTGKTSIARILAGKLGCEGSDFLEINCASKEGPDQIRDVPDFMRLYPSGKARVAYFDEFQSLSRAQFCQQALLKVMEDYPSYAYFMLASTDPAKINEALKNRCKKIELKSVSLEALKDLIGDVASEEGKPISEAVTEAIAEAADGSPRRALVNLEGVLCFDNEEKQLAAVSKDELSKTVDALLKLLMWGKGPDWKKAAEILRELKGTDPEEIRRRILGAATTSVLKADGNSKRAAVVAGAFEFPTYDAGFGKIVLSVYRLFNNDV